MLASLRGLTQSGLVVLCPEADPVVGPHRLTLDRTAVWGVPAHVTVLYPFIPPEELDELRLGHLARVVSRLPGTEVEFGDVGWFGDQVVYLRPEPSSWFRSATARIHGEFPQYPPYQGEFEDVIPHLTIGDRADPTAMKAAAVAVRSRLPVRSRITSLALMAGSPLADSWRVVRRFPLSAAA